MGILVLGVGGKGNQLNPKDRLSLGFGAACGMGPYR